MYKSMGILSNMQDYTQLGIAGLTLGILFFIVRYFVTAMNLKDQAILEQHDKLASLTERSIDGISKFTDALNRNTMSTKNNSDKLTSQILDLMKRK